MSNIYMLKRTIRFDECTPYDSVLNKLIRQDIFDFPSNVINCSLSITDFNTWRGGSVDMLTGYQNVEAGTFNFLGMGVEDISYIGNRVYFSAWMQMLDQYRGANAAGLLANESYLGVQAIAECQ